MQQRNKPILISFSVLLIARIMNSLSRILIIICLSSAFNLQAESLWPAWNESIARTAIIEFVRKVTDKSGCHYVDPQDRIAVFDNDGTLWSEQPYYVQLAFVLDRIRALSPHHPEWNEKEPFKSALRNDIRQLAAAGEHGLLELVIATHSGMSTLEFEKIVREWISIARHPGSGKLYTEMVYQPMLELISYLKSKDFKVFIVSGGGVEFMRAWAMQVYGVPAEQIIGSSIRTKFVINQGEPVLLRLPEINFIDDKEAKPVGIQMHIGRKPIAAFGNSDGDLQMLQWVASGPAPGLAMLIHHTDKEREWSYDRNSSVGRLDKALDQARKNSWPIIDMRTDWKVIYP